MYLNENCPYNVKPKTHTCELLFLKKIEFTQIKLAFNENVLLILKNSSQFLENVEKYRRIVMDIFSSGIPINIIRKKLKRLNALILKLKFDEYLNYHLSLEEVEDFILSRNIQDVISFLNTKMRESDFFEWFIKDKLQKKTTYPRSSDVSSPESSENSSSSNNNNIDSITQVNNDKLDSIDENLKIVSQKKKLLKLLYQNL